MPSDNQQTHWQFLIDFIRQRPGAVNLKEIEEHFAANGRNIRNARPDATSLSVNENSRVHYAGGKEVRRTDTGHRYDALFRQADRTYVPYEPSKHGVWEIFQNSDGTRGVRLVAEPEDSEAEIADGSDFDAGTNQQARAAPSSQFRLESHLRDYLAQNLTLFSGLGTTMSLYETDGVTQGVEYRTEVGPIDILAVGANGALYVIELKVSRGPDAAIGQVLRYMGAIRRSIANGNPVYGVIVAASINDKLRSALSEVKEKVFAMEYELKVALQPLR